MITFSIGFVADPLLACATCMGTAHDASTIAANWAIIAMGGILFPVLGGVILMIRTLKKREAAAIERSGGLPGAATGMYAWNQGGPAAS
jgi:hypothetical protein